MANDKKLDEQWRDEELKRKVREHRNSRMETELRLIKAMVHPKKLAAVLRYIDTGETSFGSDKE